MPNVEAIREWVADLRSGNYTQTTGALRGEDGYCCLGVACETFRRMTGRGRWDTFNDFVVGESAVGDELPEVVASWLGLETNPDLHTASSTECASRLNDEEGYDFSAIAEAIEYTFLRETP